MRHRDSPASRQTTFSRMVEADHLTLNRGLKQQRNWHPLLHHIPLPSSLPYEHEDFLSARARCVLRHSSDTTAILVAVEMRILIVEDDRKLARQLKKGVDEFGHSSTLAFDGREGLDAAQGSEFDVLVLDVMLPKIDGISVVRQLRQMRIGTPIRLLTARDTPDDISLRSDAGAADYLTK